MEKHLNREREREGGRESYLVFVLLQTFIVLGRSVQKVFSLQNIIWSQKLLGSSANRNAHSTHFFIYTSVSSGFLAGVWLSSSAECNIFLIVCAEHLSPCSLQMQATVANGAVSLASAMDWSRVIKNQ